MDLTLQSANDRALIAHKNRTIIPCASNFSNADQGPPSSQRVINPDGSCGNNWACEHRWQNIANMFEFGAVVQGEKYFTSMKRSVFAILF